MHPRGNYIKGVEKTIDGKIYHQIASGNIPSGLNVKAKFLSSNGHSVKWLIDENLGIVTLWVSRKDEDFKQAQKASNEYDLGESKAETKGGDV